MLLPGRQLRKTLPADRTFLRTAIDFSTSRIAPATFFFSSLSRERWMRVIRRHSFFLSMIFMSCFLLVFASTT